MLLTILSFAFVITVLVFIHELGHYLAARSTGMKVEKFSVGFPPRFLSFTSCPGGWNFKIFFYKFNNKQLVWAPIFESFIKVKNKKGSDTEYCLALLPLGGYVKIAGILDESMDTNSTGADYEYQSKKTWQKLWFTSAGVIFNFILSFIIFMILFSYQGIPKNKIDKIYDKLYPELIENIIIDDKQLVDDDLFYFGIQYVSDFDESNNIYKTNESNGEIYFQNLIGDNINKIEIELPFNIKSLSEGLSDSTESILVNFESGSNYLSIESINNSSLLNNRVGFIGKIDHEPLNLLKSPVLDKLKSGDRILSINNTNVKYYRDIDPLIKQDNNIKELTLEVLRDENIFLIEGINPISFYRYNQYGNKISVGMLGVTFETEQLSFIELLDISFNQLISGITNTAMGIFELITGQVSAKGASGPIGIAKLSGEFASQGFLSLLSLMGMLSISLGVINILPFPGLDGGHALIAIIEKLKGSKIKPQTLIKVQQFGMLVLLGLFILIFLMDLKII